ncbi:MAG: glycoside hydrolase family 31 protein [Betaproteobacteria bacterium]
MGKQRAGRVNGFQREGNSVVFHCEGGLLRLAVLYGNCVRVTFNCDHRFTGRRSVAVVNAPSCEAFSVEDADVSVVLRTAELTVEVGKADAKIKISDSDGRVVSEDVGDGLTWGRRTVMCTKAMDSETHFYGLGEKTGFLDKRGREYLMWNTDDPLHTPTKDPLYKSIPLLLVFNGKWATGTFVDYTGKIWFDLGAESDESYSFEVDDHELDYYFIYGPDLKRVIGTYTDLTGRMFLPPLWALGYQQCRWGYYPEAVVRNLADTFRERDIPCDVIYLDIDYMDGYRVFTWDRECFPDPERMLANLRAKGFKIATIVNPGVKKDPSYGVYVEGVRRNLFCRWLTGEIYHGRVWPGEAAFPDFTKEETRSWWAEKHDVLLGKGVAGIWNDMNEPSDFSSSAQDRTQATVPDDVIAENDGDPCTFGRIHNAYGLQMCRSTYEAFLRLKPEDRPFIVTRAAYAGIQRYAAVWTGDNCSWWEHLAMSLPLCMNIGLSGVPFVGGDVGGFEENATPELFARWMQVGAFTPFFRAHSMHNTRPHEPWAWGPRVEEICRKYIKLRYALLPYVYNEFYKASQTGLPVMRPLVLDYPDDERTHNLNTEFLWGESFLVAPITQPDTIKRCVYLPEGIWFDYWTDREYEGKKDYLVDAPLDTLPLFVRAGSVIPSVPAASYVGEERWEALTLDVYLGAEAWYTLYEDDGLTQKHRDGAYNLTEFHCSASEEGIIFKIRPIVSGCRSGRKTYRLRFHGAPPELGKTGETVARAEAGEGGVNGGADGEAPTRRQVVEIDVPDEARPVSVVVDKMGCRIERG